MFRKRDLGLIPCHVRLGSGKMLRVVKNVTWRQRITNEVLYAGLPRILTTIREKRLRFSGHCWRSKNEVSDLVLWEPNHGKRSVGGQACTVVDLLEAGTGVSRDCLPAAMGDRVGWRKSHEVGGGWGGRPGSSSSSSSSSSGFRKKNLLPRFCCLFSLNIFLLPQKEEV